MAVKVSIRPEVGMYSLFPHMNYKPWFALGEMVDNSIGSYVANKERLRAIHGNSFKLKIDITFSQSGSDARILVEDNAAGISEKDVSRAFTPAAPPVDKSGISQFGIGMKSSCTWYSHFYTITSSALGEDITRTVTFDIEGIIDKKVEELLVSESPKDPSVHGTRIVMSKLHQGIPIGMTLSKIQNYISSIYREFIKSGEVVITVGNRELSHSSPELLESKFWSAGNSETGVPYEVENSPKRVWQIPIDISLDESWKSDTAPNRPKSPPRIRGWMGILKDGSTKKSGAALIWKDKVVVGAGSLAQGDEDSYRPLSVFGATTTFTFQRLIGELDVSELQVTSFKDNIDWRTGQEEELQTKLRSALDAGDFPLRKMAANYRSTSKSTSSQNTVKKTLENTTKDLVDLFKNTEAIELLKSQATESPDVKPLNESDILEERVTLPIEGNPSLTFRVVIEPGDEYLFRLTRNENSYLFSINRAHIFMMSYANLPGADLEPIFRLGIALGFAEILGRDSLLDHPEFIRLKVNQILTGHNFKLGNKK
jgi:hypothetical protein